MWQGSVFLVIQSDAFPLLEVKDLLESSGAKVIVKYDYENSTNFLEHIDKDGVSSSSNKSGLITHIITDSVEFIEYDLARSAMIPITTPKWVYESIAAKRTLNPKLYNPDPKLFLKDCFVCVADNLPEGDKEVIYGAVSAFGGSYLDALTRYTTHLIALDLTNEKSIIAYSAVNGPQEELLDIKIVMPHWVDHCLTMGNKLDETPYLLTSKEKQKWEYSTPDLNLLISHEDLPVGTQFSSKFFQEKSFYIAPDYNLSERLTGSIKTLIENHGGKVSPRFDIETVDVYIGKYRSGNAYHHSCRSKRIIVGNINWLYGIIVTEKWVLPKNSNLLHYPLPLQLLPAFKDLDISVTNYSGDARTYLSKLITTLGGNFTKTMTKENHYLVAAKAEGKKYDTAKFKWLDLNGEQKVKIVNHLWLEECYSKWELLDASDPKYQFLGNGKDGVEALLGRTKLDETVVRKWEVEEEKSEAADIGDSEDENSQEMGKKEELVEPASAPEAVKVNTENPKSQESIDDIVDKSDNNGLKKTPQQESTKTPDLNAIDDNGIKPREGRSAAKKAAMKLHTDMSDLNLYQEMSKSSRKMKTYMQELEGTLTPSKRTTSEELESKSSKKPKKATQEPGSKTQEQPLVVAIMTGCELDLTLSKADIAKLLSLGIRVLSDFLNKYPINTLIAPKILRTEKFLRSLSKVEKIVHPNYLGEILKKCSGDSSASRELISMEFNIDHYSLDKFVPIKDINTELGLPKQSDGLQKLLQSDLHGILFRELSLNLSSNLNGGFDVISRILKDHGLNKAQAINGNATAAALEKSLILSRDDEEQVILVAHSSKDTKLKKSFQKLIKDKKVQGVIIEWDWCVKSIFAMQLQAYKGYELK
ncbi:uncharacterized protein CANTADRAFT_8274 [Suhomyces tanzawaensis NRRL Y-17324]|uniref:BRCT domain-containing protein n=1 Tax=Suhomyces tanzawaensis NRRL Y-17324 TaxID=984487 RepID=A0A1E4SC92_9ASCO|nr:uncharacterized protein CANTADRAFT_8274 [Suhomyces tanzawaensis NRRL Y-17324]ODV77123.1 hypothetical protein CANTADRAFT_8274 [Suhomyces tanzawaensis NRRL Y-17324]